MPRRRSRSGSTGRRRHRSRPISPTTARTGSRSQRRSHRSAVPEVGARAAIKAATAWRAAGGRSARAAASGSAVGAGSDGGSAVFPSAVVFAFDCGNAGPPGRLVQELVQGPLSFVVRIEIETLSDCPFLRSHRRGRRFESCNAHSDGPLPIAGDGPFFVARQGFAATASDSVDFLADSRTMPVVDKF